MKKKQFHFINIVDGKNIEINKNSVQQYEQEEEKEKEKVEDHEENVVFSEDVFIKRSSTINRNKMILE